MNLGSCKTHDSFLWSIWCTLRSWIVATISKIQMDSIYAIGDKVSLKLISSTCENPMVLKWILVLALHMLHDVIENQQHLRTLSHEPICFFAWNMRCLWTPPSRIIFSNSNDANNFCEMISHKKNFMQEEFHLHFPSMKIIANKFLNALDIQSRCHDCD